MPDPLKYYSPQEVALTFCGFDLSKGMADGDFFSCEPAAEGHTSKPGADGSVAIAISLDPRANAKVMTLQTSSANAILGALNASGRIGAFAMRDIVSGSLIVESVSAKIKKWPAVSRGKEVGQVEWEIELFDARWTHGATLPAPVG
jgi:hypothetical protein